MSQQTQVLPEERSPQITLEVADTQLSIGDLNDLCDATEAAITDGGGFGWVNVPERTILENFWQGVIAMPARDLYLVRLDGVISGSAQLKRPPRNNEAQAFSAHLRSFFIAPWARQYGLAQKLLHFIEEQARQGDIEVINLDIRETQTAAIRMYENAGYVQISTHPYYAKVNGKIIPGRAYYKHLA